MIDPAPSRSTVKGLPSRSPSRRASPSSSTKIRSPTLSPGLTISPSRNRTRVRLCSRRRCPSLVSVLKGTIVAIDVAPGDTVRAGQQVAIVEAMKMENELRASAAGKVQLVQVQEGQNVETGALLMALE